MKLFILISLITFCSSTPIADYESLLKYKVYDLSMAPSSLIYGKSERLIIIFYTNKTCLKCFSELGELISASLIKAPDTDLECIGLCNNTSPISKRYIIDNVGANLKSISKFRFQYKDSLNVFSEYGIEKAPALMLIDNKNHQVKLYKYDELFDNNGLVRTQISLVKSQ